MQNWDALQPTANYEQHNNWYNSMFAANIKTEPDTSALATPPGMTSAHLEQLFKQHQHHQQQQQQQQQQQMVQSIDSMSTMTPSPGNTDSNMSHFFDSTLQQQQLYQQQFQQAQQAAAQNQVASAHMPLGFNPLTPPGLPSAVLPSISHFYNNNNNNNNNNTNNNNNNNNNINNTPSALPTILTETNNNNNNNNNNNEAKLSAALTPRHTPPMDITPPKSPKIINQPDMEATKTESSTEQNQDQLMDKEQDLQSNSSEDMKYMAESEEDEAIRMPIYNSHGKMKNYRCKSCGMVAITKVAFWQHARSHMKPEKILQCPKCPFVTELKHHLEYHIRKHKNIKPFQCDKCSYTCVNKSMLNSHRKSHSSVYQYRCADCDYATKYCHSFKLHLRKYEHKPGLVLDEEGLPNPSVVIDVYGTRRGPKNKAGNGPLPKRHHERHQSDIKPSNSQLSAALQGFSQQLPTSPAKSTCSNNSEITQSSKSTANNQSLPNLLPPLATILQQNRNMAFFPYWNLNLQMLAAQQQAAVLAQLSPSMRETALQHMQMQHEAAYDSGSEDEENEEDNLTNKYQHDMQNDRKSVDSAMDLSQGTPTKEEQPTKVTPDSAMNLKILQDETNETPIVSTAGAARRKGRVLKLESKSTSHSPQEIIKQNLEVPNIPAASSPISGTTVATKLDDANSSADESMELGNSANVVAVNISTSSNVSAASSSGNSSNSSNTSSNSNSISNSSTLPVSPTAAGAIYECKYCDIFFKDAVLYTIHMGYHSCDDVFKCNMCGEKCDGPVGLFVHMARNAHS